MVFLAHHDTIDYRIINDKKLPTHFDNLNVFFISDIHRRKIKRRTIESIKEKFDFIVIGGDLTEKGVSLEKSRMNIKILRTFKVPIYFVWGNHDYEVRHNRLYKMLTEEDVIVLADRSELYCRGDEAINILGFDYHQNESHRPEINWQVAEENYTILLTHVPDAYFRLAKDLRSKINTVLAGHTHGGQIRFFGLGYYQNGGLSTIEGTHVLISEGYGYTLLPFRLQTSSQCHVLTFKS